MTLHLRTDRKWPGGQRRDPIPPWLKLAVLKNYGGKCALCGFDFGLVEAILFCAEGWWKKLGGEPRDWREVHAPAIRARLVNAGKPRKTLFEFDHISPVALEGKTNESNLRPLCSKPCHAAVTKEQVKPRMKQVRLRGDHERAMARMKGVR